MVQTVTSQGPTELTPDLPPASDLNTRVNEAMMDLVRACAIEYTKLPSNVLAAYQDRDHSKFDVLLWQGYLDGLMTAIDKAMPLFVPRRVKFAYRQVLAAQIRHEVQL